jgi:hypothetical protein
MAEDRQIAWVVVLGDFGRSPRMQYHALSLADQVTAVRCILKTPKRTGSWLELTSSP